MSQRKKRLVMMIGGVFLIAVISFEAGTILLNRNADNMNAYYKNLEGRWFCNTNKQYQLEIYRVTSAHVVAVLNDMNFGKKTPLFSATWKDENQYEFALEKLSQPEGFFSSVYNSRFGKITLNEKEKTFDLQLSPREDYQYAVRLHFSEQNPWNEKEKIELDSYIGTKKEPPAECTAFRDKDGKIRSLQIRLENEAGQKKFSVDGIHPYCFVTDCEDRWGSAVETKEYSTGDKQVIFEEGDRQYAVLVNSWGLISEIYCRKNEDDTKREGDFLMQGDTIVRYFGIRAKTEDVKLPAHAKKIAAGAFTTYESMYHQKGEERILLSLPSQMEVEKDAFYHCGKMNIKIQEGRTSISEGAFAHLVPDDVDYSSNSVSITLPNSLETIEKDSFYQGDIIPSWVKSFEESRSEIFRMTVMTAPVLIANWNGVREIAENSLVGAAIQRDSLRTNEKLTALTGGATFLFQVDIEDEMGKKVSLPSTCKTLKKGAITTIFGEIGGDVPQVILPENLETIEEDAVVPIGNTPHLLASKKSKYFWNNALGWLYSKDKTELYAISADPVIYYGIVDYKYGYEDGIVGSEYTDWFYNNEMHIPKGVKNIHGYALQNRVGVKAWEKLVLPASVEKMSRNALCGIPYDTYLEGDVPEFYGTLSQVTLSSFHQKTKYQTLYENAFGSKIYVKKENREQFISSYLEGQQITKEQRTWLEQKIKGY